MWWARYRHIWVMNHLQWLCSLPLKGRKTLGSSRPTTFAEGQSKLTRKEQRRGGDVEGGRLSSDITRPHQKNARDSIFVFTFFPSFAPRDSIIHTRSIFFTS
ncbi:hypothetical protein VUR80DRAFT_291 [Thermomyces stellatus]